MTSILPQTGCRNSSRVSKLSIVLATLLVISAFFSSTPSANVGNALSRQTGPYSEFPRRVKKFAFNPRAAGIDFLSVEFERPYLGYEGPNFTELEGEPSAGAQYLATAELFGEAAISTAKFELVHQDGKVLQLLHFFKQDNSFENGRFFGSAKIPDRPFRIAVSGMGVDGEPYRKVFERLFRPTKRPPAPPILPRDLAPRDAKRAATVLLEMEKRRWRSLRSVRGKTPME